MAKLIDLFRKRAEPGARGAGPPDPLAEKLAAFQHLLEENNAALATMADLEEKRSGEYLFDRAYLRTTVAGLSGDVRHLVEHLQTLTGSPHPGLLRAHAAIDAAVNEALRGARIDISGPPVLRLAEISAETAHLAGGKMGHLGRLAADLSLPVPPGFVVTAAAFARFMADSGILDQVRARLAGLRVDALEDMERASEEIRALIAAAPLPAEIAGAISAAAADLADGGAQGLAVRSSAVWEDGEFSFAGQYATFLNVPAAQVLRRYCDVLGSLFTPRAIFYYRTKGFAEEEMAMAVGVMRMVEARAAGVLYTRDPLDPGREVMIANGAWGLGTTVVEGAAHTDTFTLDRATGAVVGRRIVEKSVREVADAAGGVRSEPVDEGERAASCLTDAQAAELVRHGATLERHFGRPQDVEWALDGAGKLWILQSRPLQLIAATPASAPPRRVPGRRILIERGVVACKGVGAGPVVLVRSDAEAADFPAGAVLVARTTGVGLAAALPRAAALVTDVGSATGHLASLAREYRVPALLDTESATSVLQPGAEVTVDAFNGNVYEGRVEELLRHAAGRREVLEGTPLLLALGRALERITPLHLTDPSGEGFRPDACRTFHDITRYAHEKAMDAMFALGEGLGEGGARAVVLRAGIPVAIHLLDLGGGLASRGGRAVEPEAVLSVPFAALLRGMRAMTWPEPRAADVKGLLGMMAHTATISEEELRGTAEKSLALVGANYMNFSIRLGYHFSQVEAWVGERLNDNYVRFFFKGGGAAVDRRLRRVRLIAEILASMDFQVRVAEDVIRAQAAKYRRPALERTLEALGRLTAYTKQLDMAMFNDAVTNWYRDEFVREHLKPAGEPVPPTGEVLGSAAE
ncbi:MAG TPA: PEP/pyruvate-binding domain-containing protein [bacterium]